MKTEETIKLIKYVTGSVAAVLLAAAMQLQFAYAAGIITLLTIQDTKKETVRITAKRMIIFVIMTIYIELEDKTDYTGSCFDELDAMLVNLKKEALRYMNNHLITEDDYYYEYMQMSLQNKITSIAACTIGGVSVTGGRGKVSSAIIGVAVFELLKVALQYLGMNANAQYIAIGVVIFIAISLDIRKYIARK